MPQQTSDFNDAMQLLHHKDGLLKVNDSEAIQR